MALYTRASGVTVSKKGKACCLMLMVLVSMVSSRRTTPMVKERNCFKMEVRTKVNLEMAFSMGKVNTCRSIWDLSMRALGSEMK